MQKQLYRSKSQRMLGGVCGGIAEYAQLDVSLVRLIAVLAGLAGGAGVFAYLVAWIIIPETGRTPLPSDLEYTVEVKNGDISPQPSIYNHDNPETPHERGQHTNLTIGLILVGIGSYYIAKRAFPYIPFSRYLGPVILIMVGFYFLLRKK